MPMQFNAYLTTTVNATVPVELTDEELAELAGKWGVPVDALDDDMLRDAVQEKGLNNAPPNNLCVHCSGYNNDEYSLDMSDGWDSDGFRRRDDS